jgi:hypothetical protein
MQERGEFSSNKDLKFHSGMVKSLDSTMNNMKDKVSLTLAIANLKLESFFFAIPLKLFSDF